MPLSTFSELQTSVSRYVRRTDITTEIIDAIFLAEKRASRDLRVRPMETTDTAFSITGELVALPTGFKAAKLFFIPTDPVRKLEYLSHNQIFTQFAGEDAGDPTNFTYEGDNFRFRPAPSSTITSTLVFWKEFDNLSDAQPTSGLLTNYPEILLYGTCLEVGIFLKSKLLTDQFAPLYQNAVDKAQLEDDKDRSSGSVLTPKSDTSTP